MKRNLLSVALCLFFFLLLLFPAAVQAGAKEGMFLWYHTIVPILFPFLLLSNLLVTTGALRQVFSFFSPLFGCFPSSYLTRFCALVLGWLCGYPMGAKTLSDLVQMKKITRREADFLLPAANQPSPVFLTGYLGVSVFQNRYPHWKIFLGIYLPVFCYLFFGRLFSYWSSGFGASHSGASQVSLISTGRKTQNSTGRKTQKNSMSFSMEHTILDSFHTLISIGVYMMLFTILMRLSLLCLPKTRVLSVMIGFLEMSTGISWFSQLAFPTQVVRDSLILACAAFGGLCTMAQTYGVTEKAKLSLPVYFLGKVILGFASFFLFSCLIS